MKRRYTHSELVVALGGVPGGPPSLREQLCQTKARLQVVCQWLRDTGQWEAFLRSREYSAADWLDEDGVPK